MKETVRKFDKLCPKCKGELNLEIRTYYNEIDDQDWSERCVFCPQCDYASSEGLEPEVRMKMTVTPPLDYLLQLPDGWRTDLRKIAWENRPWAYIAGQILPASPSALPLNQYCLIIYTLFHPSEIYPSHNRDVEYFWQLEKQGDLQAPFEIPGKPFEISGRPIVRSDKEGVWKAIVDVGYAYFILVTVRGYREPGYRLSHDFYQSRLPFDSLDGVVLTKLVQTEEVFHPGH